MKIGSSFASIVTCFCLLLLDTALPATAQPRNEPHFSRGAVLLFTPQQPTFEQVIPLGSNWLFNAVVLSPDAAYVAAFARQFEGGLEKHYVYIWRLTDVNPERDVIQLQPDISLEIDPSEGDADDHSVSLVFSLDTHHLAMSLRNRLLVLDLQDERPEDTKVVVNDFQIRGQLDWSSDGRYVAGVIDNRYGFLIWDRMTGTTTHVELEDPYDQLVHFGDQWLLIPRYNSQPRYFAVCDLPGHECIRYNEEGVVSALDSERGLIYANLYSGDLYQFIQSSIWQRQRDGSYQSLGVSEWGDQFMPYYFSPNGKYLLGRNLSGDLTGQLVQAQGFHWYGFDDYDQSWVKGTLDIYHFAENRFVQRIDDLTKPVWVRGDEYYVQWDRLMRVGNNIPLDIVDWAADPTLAEVYANRLNDRVDIQGAPPVGNWVLYNITYNYLVLVRLI